MNDIIKKTEEIFKIKRKVKSKINNITFIDKLQINKPILEANEEDKKFLSELITKWNALYEEIKEEKQQDKDKENHSMRGIPKPYHIILNDDPKRIITTNIKQIEQFQRVFNKKVRNYLTKEEIDDLLKIDKDIPKYLMMRSVATKYYLFYRKIDETKISKINVSEGVIIFNPWQYINNKRVVKNSSKIENIKIYGNIYIKPEAEYTTIELLKEYGKNGFTMDEKLKSQVNINNF